MDARRLRGLLVPAAFALVSPIASPALAQDAVDASALNNLGDLIRWSGVVTSLLVVVGAWVLLRLLRRSVSSLGSEFSTRRLTLEKLNTITQFVIYVATTVVVLALSLRIDQTGLAVLGGTAAVAFGFAIKDIVASFIAGIIVILDRPFQVGDRVTFGGVYGDITAIGLRSVRLQTLDDNTVTIPNSKFLSDITASGNYGALDMMVVMNFYIAMDEDIDAAREIVTEAALSSRYVFLGKPIVVLVTQWISEYLVGVRLELKAYVLDTQHEKAFETDVNLRVLRTLKASGIAFPSALPHSTERSRVHAP
jgi:small-conductance mechanosensitive channel